MAVNVTAPMSGKISEIFCKIGDQVSVEDELMILEALKMENPIFAPADGRIAEIKVEPGAAVESNQLLLVIE